MIGWFGESKNNFLQIRKKIRVEKISKKEGHDKTFVPRKWLRNYCRILRLKLKL